MGKVEDFKNEKEYEMIKDRFTMEMVRIYDRCREGSDYVPSYFIRMVMGDGGVETAKSLLSTSEIQEGFIKLWENNRLDLSMEALVIKEPWNKLFTKDELKEAERRLREAEYLK